MSTVTVNSNTYSSAGEAANDMRNGGHRTHLLPMLADAVVDLAAKVTAAQLAETNAEAAAVSALTAPGTQATSATSLAIATGSKSFTIQTGKSFSPGQAIIAASDAAPAIDYMWGLITSYNSGTGALVLAISVIGGSGTHADWTLSLSPNPTANNLNAAQNFARATVASHATTADIWAAAGNQIDWTGTATTTAFPNAPQAGAERVLICAGACSFTAGTNMLIDGVASAATVTCAAGDSVIVRAVSTTQFKLSRVKYDGTAQVAAGGGAWVWLSTVTASASATVDIETTFDSTYDNYAIVAVGVVVASDNASVGARLKVAGAYATTGYESFLQINTVGTTVYTEPVSNYTATEFMVMPAHYGGTNPSEVADFTMFIRRPASTTQRKTVSIHGMGHIGSAHRGAHFVGGVSFTDTGAVTGVRFLASGGNIASGTFRLYGIKNS